MNSRNRVYVSVTEPHRTQAILAALSASGVDSVTATDNLDSAKGQPDVIVSDSAAAFGGLPDDLHAQNATVIAIGWEGPGEANLPADATPREIAIACELTLKIVRLKRDRDDHQRQRSKLDDLAHTDPLTGQANLLAWQRELASRWEVSQRTNSLLCLAIVDLDFFKNVNDTAGHAVGDIVLQAAATGLATAIRSNDFIARLGGDEFGLLLCDLAPELAASIVDRIRSRVAATTEQVGHRVTASAGFAIANSRSSTEESFERADTALRRAKQRGRDCTKAAD